MKKVLFLLLATSLLFSCSKDEEAKTTIQIINDVATFSSSHDYLDGSVYIVDIITYSGEDIKDTENIESLNADGSISEVIELKNSIDNVQISFSLLPKASADYNSAYNTRKYFVSKTTITPGVLNEIKISEGTFVIAGQSTTPTTVSSCLNTLDTNL